MLVRLVLFVASGLVALSLGGGASVAAPRPQVILFVTPSWADARPPGPWTIGADGRRLARLHVPAAEVDDPTWAPNGQRIALTFSMKRGTETPNLAVVPTGRRVNKLRRIATVSDWGPKWSPNGRWIAFVGWAGSKPLPGGLGRPRAVYVIHPDGSGLRRVSPPANYYWGDYVWAPDSTRLVVGYSVETRDCESRLVLARTDGRFRSLGVCGSDPVWTPSGDAIIYAAEDWPFGGGLRLVRPDGSGQRKLTSGMDWRTDLSPDGNKVVFLRQANDITNARSVVVFDLRTKRESVVAKPRWDIIIDPRPSWSPDGTMILFGENEVETAPAICTIWIVRNDGTGLRRLIKGTGCTADWKPQ